MANNKLTISIVTVCYNAAESIEDTMLSVINQSYPNIEYVIIDGGSVDGTVDIIKRYAHRLAYWISEPDKGIYDAMNKGAAVATGDYINFMNAGDKFANNEIINLVVDIIEKQQADILFGNHYTVDQAFNKVKYCRARNVDLLKRGMPFCHQAVFTKLSYQKKNLFDNTYRIYADRVFFRNALLKDHQSFRHIDFPVCYFDCTSGMSHDNVETLYQERYRYWGIENNKLKQLPYELIKRGVLLKKKLLKLLK